MKNKMFKLIGIGMVMVTLAGIGMYSNIGEAAPYFRKLKANKTLNIVNQELNILSSKYEREDYYYGDEIVAEVLLQNAGESARNISLGYSLRDASGNYIDIAPKAVNIPAKSSQSVKLSYIPESVLTGNYEAVFTIWETDAVTGKSKKIASTQLKNAFRIYRGQEEFKDFNSEFWIKRNGKLGRTALKAENVSVQNDNLAIKLPANNLTGGEIFAKEEISFGSYEVRMKLPNSPSSITGFFLYKEPDFYNEIDIELYNQPNSELMLTTYDNGEISNQHKQTLSFDPTAEYHNYRIDYYSNRVTFYIDDQLIKSWNKGFSKEPMRLMLNSWYPTWLSGVAPGTDRNLEVDWIKY